MNELKKALKISIILQLICWIIFTICDENPFTTMNTAENIALLSGVAIQIGISILYFRKIDNYIQKNNLNSIKFHIFLIISWIIISVIISYILSALVESEILHVCSGGFGCLLNGIEYAMEAIVMILQVLVTIIVKLIIKFYKSTKSNKSTNN